MEGDNQRSRIEESMLETASEDIETRSRVQLRIIKVYEKRNIDVDDNVWPNIEIKTI